MAAISEAQQGSRRHLRDVDPGAARSAKESGTARQGKEAGGRVGGRVEAIADGRSGADGSSRGRAEEL